MSSNSNKTPLRVLAGLLLGLCLLAKPLPLGADTVAVNAVLGASVVCDPAISTCLSFPTSSAFLCDGTGAILDCPQWFAPDWVDTTGLRFFGITNRTNPPRCLQSTVGGVGNWSLCPSNPFAAAIDFFGAFLTVASDGSLIAVGDQGANNCIIRRSTDYGANWSTVFTDTTINTTCGVAFGNPTFNQLRCASTNAYCVTIRITTGTFDWQPLFSTDNGANWTIGTNRNIASTDAQFAIKIATDASLGINTHLGISYNNTPMAIKSGNNFDLTSNVPLPPGAGGATRCTGVMIFNGNRTAICSGDTNFPTTYRRFDIIGTAPTLIASFIPPNFPAISNGPTFMAHDFGGIGYIIGRDIPNTKVAVNISLDGFASAPNLALLTPTTPLIPGCCTGDVFTFGGKIYFTGGGTSSQAWFARIQ